MDQDEGFPGPSALIGEFHSPNFTVTDFIVATSTRSEISKSEQS